jgi:SAM-dependent methyltransferase
MDQAIADPTPAVNIDTLMARIRSHAERRAAERDPPTSPGPAQLSVSSDFRMPDVRGPRELGQALRSQTELNRSLIEALTWTAEHLAQLEARSAETERRAAAEAAAAEARINAAFASRLDALAARLQEVEAHAAAAVAAAAAMESQVAGRLDATDVRMDLFSKRLNDETRRGLDELRMRVLRAERWIRRPTVGQPAAGATARQPSPARPAESVNGHAGDEPGGPASTAACGQSDPSGPADSAVPAFDYFMFEHRFRGSVSDIKQRQLGYLDLFRGRSHVVDLGCGRGEFVELLTENGIGVTGVDANEDMVDFCRDRGLPVVRADLFAHLEGLPDASLDGVFAAQVVEHLPPRSIARLIGLCGRKLGRHGVVVFETINPTCPEAMNWFYLDPSHVRPVPADLLQFMAEEGGLQVRGLRFSAPLPTVSQPGHRVLEVAAGTPPEAAAYQDYALIAFQGRRANEPELMLADGIGRAEVTL